MSLGNMSCISWKSLPFKYKSSNHKDFQNNNYIYKENLHTNKGCISTKFLYYSSVVVISIVVYLNSINGEFVHDDLVAIVRNPDVTEQTSIMEVFVHDFWGREISDPKSHKSYRPVATLTFR